MAEVVPSEPPSPQLKVPLSESPAVPLQERFAVTFCPVLAPVGFAAKVQLGATAVLVTVTEVGEFDIEPVTPVVLSDIEAVTEYVGLLAFEYV